MTNHKILVISPTYNESENINKFISEILDLKLEILIIDDNSPDGTSQLIKTNKNFGNNLHLISRKEKLGYGTAVIEGFNFGIRKKYEYIIQMDADLSHRSIDLTSMIKFIDNFDVIIGSRYIPGGGSEGWGIHRKLLSKYANKLAKFVTKSGINDMTTGFRIYKRSALESINFKESKLNGYSFLVDILDKCVKAKLSIKEAPILFVDRELGKSKMNIKIIIEGVKTLFKLYFQK